jgi:DNA helicase HerA-like ATPase
MRFYPNHLVKHKNKFYQYAKKVIHLLLFFSFQFFYFTYHLIFESDGNPILLGIGVTLSTLFLLVTFQFFNNIDENKFKVIIFEKKLDNFFYVFLEILVLLIFYLLFLLFFEGVGSYKIGDFLFILLNRVLVVTIMAWLVIFILFGVYHSFEKLTNKFSKKDSVENLRGPINQNKSVLNVISNENTRELLTLTNKKQIEFRFQNIDLVSFDVTTKNNSSEVKINTFTFNFKEKNVEISHKNKKIASLKFDKDGVFLDESSKSLLNGLSIVIKFKENLICILYETIEVKSSYILNLNSSDIKKYYCKVKQKSGEKDNKYIFFVNEEDINKNECIYLVDENINVNYSYSIPVMVDFDSHTYSNFKYVIEIDNFRFQDLDESRKETISNLLYTSIFEKNIYNGFFLKTHMNNYQDKSSFKSSHIYLILEDRNELKNSKSISKFLNFYNELKNDFNGFNLKISMPNSLKTIEILHNIYSKKEFQIRKDFGFHHLSEFNHDGVMALYKKNLDEISSLITFKYANSKDYKSEDKDYKSKVKGLFLNNGFEFVSIKMKDDKGDLNNLEFISTSHADFLPFDGEIGAFNKLFSRSIDETIKISFTKFNQKTNGKNKILSRTNKYFRKLYPDKKIFNLRYKSEENNIRSGIIKMFDDVLYNISIDVVKKMNYEDLNVQLGKFEVYKSQGIFLKMSFNDHMKQANTLLNPVNNIIDSKEDFLYSGIFIASGQTLSQLGIFGESFDYNPDGGIYLGKNLDVNQNQSFDVPVYVDFSEYVSYNKNEVPSSNGHMVIVGKSGSGKTFLTKSIIHQKNTVSNRQIIIFDIEDDYEFNTNISNSIKIIDIASHQDGVNPFKIVFHPDELKDNSSKIKIYSRHTYFLQLFLKEVFNVENASFESEIYSLISHVYALKGITTDKIKDIDLNKFKDYPTMELLLKAINVRRLEVQQNKDLKEQIMNYNELNALFVSLENQLIELLKDKFWTEKFNKNYDDLNFDQYEFIRINLKEVIRSSKVVKTYNLSLKLLMNVLEIHIFNRNILNEKELKVIKDNGQQIGIFVVVDEAHRYFRKEMLFMIDFFASIAKQGRKRVIELCMVSQNISDFYRQSDSKDIEQKASDIIKNSGYKFVLQVAQDYDRIYDFIESGFVLSDIEKSRLRSINRYRVYLIQGPFKRTLIQIKAKKSKQDLFENK